MSYDPEKGPERKKPQLGIPEHTANDVESSLAETLAVFGVDLSAVPESPHKTYLLDWFSKLDGGFASTPDEVGSVHTDSAPKATTQHLAVETRTEPRRIPPPLPKFVFDGVRPSQESITLHAVLKTLVGLNDERVALLVAMAGLRPGGVKLGEVARVISNTGADINMGESEIADKLSEMVDYRITPLGIGSIDQSVRSRLDQTLILTEKGTSYSPTAALLLAASARLPLVAVRDIFPFPTASEAALSQRYVTLRRLVETKQGKLVAFNDGQGHDKLLAFLRDTEYVRAIPTGKEKPVNLPVYTIKDDPRRMTATTEKGEIRKKVVQAMQGMQISQALELALLLDFPKGMSVQPSQARAIVIDELERQVKAGFLRLTERGTFIPKVVQIQEPARQDGLRGLLDVVDATVTNAIDTQLAADVMTRILSDPTSIKRPIGLAYRKTRPKA